MRLTVKNSKLASITSSRSFYGTALGMMAYLFSSQKARCAGEKAVLFRMFMAYGNGHRSLPRIGNTVNCLGGFRIFCQKEAIEVSR